MAALAAISPLPAVPTLVTRPAAGTGAAAPVRSLVERGALSDASGQSGQFSPQGPVYSPGGVSEVLAQTVRLSAQAQTRLEVTTTSLPVARAGAHYFATLSGSGGLVPYSWSLARGALPAGLKLSRAGALTGVPHAAGTSVFTVTMTDAGRPALTGRRTLAIAVGGYEGPSPRTKPLSTTTTAPNNAAAPTTTTTATGPSGAETPISQAAPGIWSGYASAGAPSRPSPGPSTCLGFQRATRAQRPSLSGTGSTAGATET